jgi:hypothetical protein
MRADAMVPTESEFSPLDPIAAVVEQPPPLAASPDVALRPERLGRLLIFAAVAGLLAGVASEFICERIISSYNSDLNPPLTLIPRPEDMRRWKEARVYTATFTFATLGGLLGLALGIAGGLARRSVVASSLAATLGLVFGSVSVGFLSLALVTYFYKLFDPISSDLVLPLLTHSAIWSTVGAIAGLAFGLGIGGRGRWIVTLGGGLAGAVMATVIYEIVGAIAFASSKTEMPLSASVATRALALLLVASLSSVGAVLALHQPTKKKGKTAVPS